MSNEELIQILQREGEVLSQRGLPSSALEARRLANDLNEAIRLHRLAADEALRLGRHSKSPHATPQDVVAFNLARAVSRDRRRAVLALRDLAARFLNGSDHDGDHA